MTDQADFNPEKIRVRQFGTRRPAHRYAMPRSQAGFTLLEILISIAIAVFLVFGTLALYSGTRAAFHSQEYLAQLIENGRTASEIMERTIRMARYWGCSGLRDASVTNHLGSQNQGLFGINNDANSEAAVKDGTDTITVFEVVDDTGVQIVDVNDPANTGTNPDPLSATAVIWVEKDEADFKSGDYVAINNCEQADVFALTGATTSGSNDLLTMTGCSTCTQHYQTDASIYLVRRTRFYIGTGTGGEPALFQQINGGTAQELIPGVENMQIYYGEDTDDDGTVNHYVRAEVINDTCTQDSNADCWRGIAAVRVALLLRTTEDGIAKTPQTYLFDGATVTAPDKRLRREFLNVISVRNHRT